jgi:predicted NAD/FAD-binding protein
LLDVAGGLGVDVSCRFCRVPPSCPETQLQRTVSRPSAEGLSLGEYFAQRKFTLLLLSDDLAPMGAANWSAPAKEMLDFPVENFVALFYNHRLSVFSGKIMPRRARSGEAISARPVFAKSS